MQWREELLPVAKIAMRKEKLEGDVSKHVNIFILVMRLITSLVSGGFPHLKGFPLLRSFPCFWHVLTQDLASGRVGIRCHLIICVPVNTKSSSYCPAKPFWMYETIFFWLRETKKPANLL